MTEDIFENKDKIKPVGNPEAVRVREKNSSSNETNPSTQGEKMSEVTPNEETTEKPIVEIDKDAAVSRTRAFFRRHKGKFVIAGLFGLSATSFVAGRKSNEVVEDVDVVVTTPEDPEPQD